MAKCSLCGSEMRFGQQSFALSTLDGKICAKCQQTLTKKKTHSKDCDIEYLKGLELTASTSRNKAYIQELIAIPEAPDPEDVSFSDSDSDISESELSLMMETTGFDFEGYSIVNYNGVVFSETAMGTGAFSEFSAGISDFLGSKSKAFTSKLSKARNYAMIELKKEAYRKGGNAIIGISLEYAMFSGNIIGVSARGTAVTIEKI